MCTESIETVSSVKRHIPIGADNASARLLVVAGLGSDDTPVAFAIPTSELSSWEAWLAEKSESRRKRSARGSWASKAFTFAIRTAT
jgi:hypothetical protein